MVILDIPGDIYGEFTEQNYETDSIIGVKSFVDKAYRSESGRLDRILTDPVNPLLSKNLQTSHSNL